MILVDSSVWIEFLRATGTRAHGELRILAATAPEQVAICEPIAMELLAGPTDERSAHQLEAQLGTLDDLVIAPADDYRAAAAIARAVRRNGDAVRSLTDCLIAAVALRYDAVVWHCDVDFERIASVTPLKHRDLR